MQNGEQAALLLLIKTIGYGEKISRHPRGRWFESYCAYQTIKGLEKSTPFHFVLASTVSVPASISTHTKSLLNRILIYNDLKGILINNYVFSHASMSLAG